MLLVAPIVVMIACGYVADALWPTLVEEHPLWLLGLSARNRYAVLVVNEVSAWSYYLVGTLRLLAPDPFFFVLGWFYGPAAVRWMERRSPTVGATMARLEGWFGRWGHPLVVALPNNYVCLIAGAARMSPVVFVVLNVAGTVGRLFLLQLVGDVFSGPIDGFLGLVADYRIPLLVASTLVVVVVASRELRQGRRDIEELEQLEPDLDAVSDGPGSPPAGDPPADSAPDGTGEDAAPGPTDPGGGAGGTEAPGDPDRPAPDPAHEGRHRPPGP